ncbi:glucose 1-dehydrogenase [Mycobacterium sp.]|uniref:glucose 1-dehydrogenase n=1 Tax=Mycobacterium sp. TaxID=1785 RepID=UPI003D0E1B67
MTASPTNSNESLAGRGLDGKSVLIVGGTSGIGRATAITLVAAGARVMVGGRRRSEGEETVALAKQAGGEARFMAMDTAKAADHTETVAATVAAWGRLDGAFNNAGTEGTMAPLHEQTDEDFDRVVAINQKGVFFGMREQIRQMLTQGGGAIVNTSSIGGVVGFANTSLYCGTKHAVIGMTRSAALEVGGSNIRVNAIAPGATRTRVLSNMSGGEAEAEANANAIPLGRIATPAEVADAVAWLLSDHASYVTGHTLLADGGFTAQ